MEMLQKLSLFDFRNYAERHFEFERKVVFWGENGRGKTNILEAISLLSVGKSWREKSATDLIMEGKGSAMIQGTDFEKNLLKVQIQPRSRMFQKNEKKIPLKKYFGILPTLLFVPEHLHLFSGTKTARQQYFDRFLAQILPTYRDHLLRANRARKQKNAILKAYRDEFPHFPYEQILPWNEILAEVIPAIWKERSEFLTQINPVLQAELEKISAVADPIKIALETPEEFEPTSSGVLAFFEKNKEREAAAGKCLLGPHRDDFAFFFRDKPLLSSASRGEERSVLLALLSAKKKLLQDTLGQLPILLLDDVFSELDAKRQGYLEQICGEAQVFFTTTHEAHFEQFEDGVQKFEIK